jgi:hypothetical protein
METVLPFFQGVPSTIQPRSDTMTGTELAQIYEFSYEAIQRNLDGLTNGDSVLCPSQRATA